MRVLEGLGNNETQWRQIAVHTKAECPTAPLHPSSQGITMHEATITWLRPAYDGGDHALKYTIEICGDTGHICAQSDNCVRKDLNCTRFEVWGLSNKLYVSNLTRFTLYQVTIWSNHIVQDNSCLASSRIDMVTLPDTPSKATHINAWGTSLSSVSLSWNAPRGNWGGWPTNKPFLSYAVEYRSDSSEWVVWDTVSLSSNGTIQYVATPLVQNTAYQFRIQVHTAGGSSEYSDAVCAITVATMPMAPAVSSVTVHPRSASVHLQANEMYGSLLMYEVNTTLRTNTSSGAKRSWNTQGAHDTMALHQLQPGLTYTINARALSSSHFWSPWSSTKWFTTDHTIPLSPGRPTAYIAGTTDEGSARATISWAVPADTGGIPLLRYVLLAQRGSGEFKPLSELQGCTTTICMTTVSGLQAGSSYVFIARALNALGESTSVKSAILHTPIGRPQRMPAPSVNCSGPRTCSVEMYPPPYDGGSPVTAYYAFTYNNGTLVKRDFVALRENLAPGSYTTHDISNLKASTAYSFCTVASTLYYSDSDSTCSVPVEKTTPQGVPLPPQSVRLTYQEHASAVLLSWDPPTDDGGLTLRHYLVDYAEDELSEIGNRTSVLSAVTNATYVLLNNLHAGTIN